MTLIRAARIMTTSLLPLDERLALTLDAADRQLDDIGRRISGAVVNISLPKTVPHQRLVPLIRSDGTPLWHLASVVE